MTEVFRDHIFFVPLALASASVLVVFLLFATNTLGSQYDASTVWGNTTTLGIECELEQPDRFIRRPVTATFSACFCWTGFLILTRTVRDLATLPQDRNLHSLLHRETYWGVVLGLPPVFVGVSSYLALASSAQYWSEMNKLAWWVCINSFAAFAWARALAALKQRIDSEDVDVEVEDESDERRRRLRVVYFSYASLGPLVVLAITLNVLLGVFRAEIVRGQGEAGLVFVLVWNVIAAVYVHWKLTKKRGTGSSEPAWFAASLALGMGSLVIYAYSAHPFLCTAGAGRTGGVVQPYATFQCFAALSVLFAYRYFRSDATPVRYRVVVQNHRELMMAGMGMAMGGAGAGALQSAYFVPEDDPYAAAGVLRGKPVPSAMPASPPTAVRTSLRGGEDARGGGVRSNSETGGRPGMLQRDGSERGGGGGGGGGSSRLLRDDSFGSQHSGSAAGGGRTFGSNSEQQHRSRGSRGNSLGGGDIPIVMAVPVVPAAAESVSRSSRALSATMDSSTPSLMAGGRASASAAAAPPPALATASVASITSHPSMMSATTTTTRPGTTSHARQSLHEVSTLDMPTTATTTTTTRQASISSSSRPLHPHQLQQHQSSSSSRRGMSVTADEPPMMTRERASSSSVVPGRSRRTSVDVNNNSNAALRVLDRGGGGERSVERERALSGAALDSRTVQLRSPEEARQRQQSLLAAAVATSSSSTSSSLNPDGAAQQRGSTSSAPSSNMTTEQRLDFLRRQRAQLQRERGLSGAGGL